VSEILTIFDEITKMKKMVDQISKCLNHHSKMGVTAARERNLKNELAL
jgi:hypothetical protein